jgi:hypothetical protein
MLHSRNSFRFVFFLLGDSLASELFVPTFWNTLFQLHGVMYSVRTTREGGMECFEMSAYKIQTPENHTNERIQYSQHGEIGNQELQIFYIVVHLPTIVHAED